MLLLMGTACVYAKEYRIKPARFADVPDCEPYEGSLNGALTMRHPSDGEGGFRRRNEKGPDWVRAKGGIVSYGRDGIVAAAFRPPRAS